MQLRSLQKMLRFCEERVPFYTDLFAAAGVRAADIRSLEDLRKIPTSTREEIVAAYPDRLMWRSPKPEDTIFRTSGTSGLFMEIAYSEKANDLLDAIYVRALINAGLRPWQRMSYFWWEDKPRPPRVYERLGLMRKHFLSLDPDPRKHLDELRRFNAPVIYSFPSMMAMVARIVREEGPGGLTPDVVICHGELMPNEIQAAIAEALDCPVFDHYGAQEFNRLGWDCKEHAGMHLDADSVILEIMDGEEVLPVGEEGEVVVTGLHNDLMPLIRYRLGDVGRLLPDACPCGRGLPLFEITEGRKDDVLTLPDGVTIGPRSLSPRIEALPGFSQYRVIQRGLDSIEVLVVRDRADDERVLQAIDSVVRNLVGPAVTVDVQGVESIPLSRRGKLQKVVSLARQQPNEVAE